MSDNPYDILEAIERRVAAGSDPFSQIVGKATKRYEMAVQTQHAIIQYAEPMAQFLAEAAVASFKATGDSPMQALSNWELVIIERARELIREKMRDQPDKPIQKALREAIQKERDLRSGTLVEGPDQKTSD